MKKTLFLFAVLFLFIREKGLAQNEDYLVQNVSIITMENDSVLRNKDVLISCGRIKQIGKDLQVDTSVVKRIDGTNKYLMPGLADMHMHFWGDSTALRLYLANGITTIRCTSGRPEYIKWQKEVKEGKKTGPQIYCTGPLMNDISFLNGYMPFPPKIFFFGISTLLIGGIGYTILRLLLRTVISASPYRLAINIGLPIVTLGIGYLVATRLVPVPFPSNYDVCVFTGNWEVKRAVRNQVKIGYDAIKPYTSMTRSEFVALMEEANRLNISVVGHIPARVRIDDVIKYKMAGLAHVEELRYHFYKGYDFNGWAVPYDQIDTTGLDNITKRLKNANIFVTSSLIPCKEYIERQENDSAFFSKAEMKYVPLKTLDLYKKEGFKSKEQYPEEEYKLLTTMFKSCHKNGVKIVLGTDSRWMNDVHGFAVHEELKLLVENGLSNFEALQAATKNAAISVNAFNDWGSVNEGKLANLILLDKNPLVNIENTKSINAVFNCGKFYDKNALDTMLKEIYKYNQENDRVISSHP